MTKLRIYAKLCWHCKKHIRTINDSYVENYEWFRITAKLWPRGIALQETKELWSMLEYILHTYRVLMNEMVFLFLPFDNQVSFVCPYNQAVQICYLCYTYYIHFTSTSWLWMKPSYHHYRSWNITLPICSYKSTIIISASR